jgi:hypothetical protein
MRGKEMTGRNVYSSFLRKDSKLIPSVAECLYAANRIWRMFGGPYVCIVGAMAFIIK